MKACLESINDLMKELIMLKIIA